MSNGLEISFYSDLLFFFQFVTWIILEYCR